MAQVIKKRRIVLASVLKPVDEPRMFERIGASLAAAGHSVTIIAHGSRAPVRTDALRTISIGFFERLTVQRLMAGFRILKKTLQLKPEHIIINTPELLWVGIVNRIFFGRKIIYDVLENYTRNIRHTPAFPAWVRPGLAAFVRLVEWSARPFLHQHWVAEKGYLTELPFLKKPLVLENKLPQSIAQHYQAKRTAPMRKLIFTGTLAETTGVFEAIRITIALHHLDPAFTLHIVGYAALPQVRTKLMEVASRHPYITLTGIGALVPHHDILQHIQTADAGFIIYPPNPSTASSIPTKLFEYLALGLPILIHHTETTEQLVRQYQAGVLLRDLTPEAILHHINNLQPFTPALPDTIYWDADARQLTID